MAKMISSMDWALVQSFLAVAEAGSLSAAARALGASQPTLGRQIRALEEALGVELFHRRAAGLAPTEVGQALIPAAQAMRKAAGQIALTAAGRADDLQGTVRITASEFVAHYVLPGIVATILDRHPEIEVEVVPSDTSENLLFREADIAVRMYRPTQLDVVTKHLGDAKLGLFAARKYLAKHPAPTEVAHLMNHRIVGYDRNESIIQGFHDYGMRVDRHAFAARCDQNTVYWELVRAGCGIGFGQLLAGMDDPALQQVLPEMPLPALPVWLTAHENMRHTARVRRVWDMLAEGLAPHLA